MVEENKRLAKAKKSDFVASELADETKRTKVFHLLRCFFQKHDPNAVDDEEVMKVLQWTKQNGYEALNERLQNKYHESFNDFLVHSVNSQGTSSSQLSGSRNIQSVLGSVNGHRIEMPMHQVGMPSHHGQQQTQQHIQQQQTQQHIQNHQQRVTENSHQHLRQQQQQQHQQHQQQQRPHTITVINGSHPQQQALSMPGQPVIAAMPQQQLFQVIQPQRNDMQDSTKQSGQQLYPGMPMQVMTAPQNSGGGPGFYATMNTQSGAMNMYQPQMANFSHATQKQDN